jgi:transcriptional regulator with XRE-family HTH domain
VSANLVSAMRRKPQSVLRDVGRRIAEIRVSRGMTQEQFAEKVLRVSLKYLQRVEGGAENLTILSLAKLANRVRVSVRELFDSPVMEAPGRGRPRKQPRK